jgi:hypothetical protein
VRIYWRLIARNAKAQRINVQTNSIVDQRYATAAMADANPLSSTSHRFDAKNSQVTLRAASAMHARAAAGGAAQARGVPVTMFEMEWRALVQSCAAIHLTSAQRLPIARQRPPFDYLLAPPPRMPIVAVRRCSSVPPIIIGAVCAVVVADPFREYVRTPLGFDHTPSPTGTVYSGLYRRSIMAPRSEPAVLMPVYMEAC